jgi:hypothetical protein
MSSPSVGPAGPVVPKSSTRAFTRDGIQWARLIPTAGLVIISVGAIQFAMNANHGSEAAGQPEPAPVETALGLHVTALPHQLEIRWNRDAAAVSESAAGEMRITEDGITEALPIDQAELRDGYVAYTPKTNDVSIRFEVTAKDGSKTAESVRSVAIP